MDFFRLPTGSDRIGIRKKAPTRPRSTTRQQHNVEHVFVNLIRPSRIGNVYRVLLARVSRLHGVWNGSGR